MIVEVDKKDLVHMVLGCEPDYEVINELINRKLGSYCGGFNDRWDWNKYALEELSEQELFDLYEKVKR